LFLLRKENTCFDEHFDDLEVSNVAGVVKSCGVSRIFPRDERFVFFDETLHFPKFTPEKLKKELERMRRTGNAKKKKLFWKVSTDLVTTLKKSWRVGALGFRCSIDLIEAKRKRKSQLQSHNKMETNNDNAITTHAQRERKRRRRGGVT
jgi:hypothetical protein